MPKDRISQSKSGVSDTVDFDIDPSKVSGLVFFAGMEVDAGSPVGTVAIFMRIVGFKKYTPWLNDEGVPVLVDVSTLAGTKEFYDSKYINAVRFVFSGVSGGTLRCVVGGW